MAETLPYRGTKLVIGERELVVPELLVAELEDHPDEDATMADPAAPRARKMAATRALLTAALRRNYPELTAEEIRATFKLSQLPAVTAALYATKGDGKPSGEEVPPSR